MNILLTGSSGLIGSHIKEYLQNQSTDTIFAPTSQELDITSPDSIDSYFVGNEPNIVIHCAAFTDVNAGELQRNDKNGSAWKINVEGTKKIVDAVKISHAQLIHISTDVIFAGRSDDKGPYLEDHEIETNPDNISWYGWTKAEAERIVHQNLTDAAIVRISNPTRAKFDNKLDYVRKIVNAFDQKKPIQLFDDQHLTLTYVDELSEAISQMIQIKSKGIFHVSSSNLFTPFELADYTLQKARSASNVVMHSSIEEYLSKPENTSRYPQYGGLDVQMTEEILELEFRTWQEIIDELVAEGI